MQVKSDVGWHARQSRAQVDVAFGEDVGMRRCKKAERAGEERNKQEAAQQQNVQYQGFARGHPPYYWPGSNHLNFRDRTGSGAL